MLISTKKKFLFIHNPKTAGTSLTRALEDYSNPHTRSVLDRIGNQFNKIGLIDDYRFRSYDDHMKAVEVKANFAERDWNSMFKFGFVRNPFDRIVSFYLYTKRTPETKAFEKVRELTFDEYVDALLDDDAFAKRKKVYQRDYFVDQNNDRIVDFIGRFESFESDVQKISEHIDCPIRLQKVNSSVRKHYRDYYTESTRQKVEDYTKVDLDYFNYQF